MHNAYVDVDRAMQDAAWLAGSSGDTVERNLARAYLEMIATCAGANADKARLDWFDRIWSADDINALDLAWQSSTSGPAGSGRAAIDAAIAVTDRLNGEEG